MNISSQDDCDYCRGGLGERVVVNNSWVFCSQVCHNKHYKIGDTTLTKHLCESCKQKDETITKLRECVEENLKFDEEVFKKTDAKGANLSCIVRSRQCLKEIEREG